LLTPTQPRLIELQNGDRIDGHIGFLQAGRVFAISIGHIRGICFSGSALSPPQILKLPLFSSTGHRGSDFSKIVPEGNLLSLDQECPLLRWSRRRPHSRMERTSRYRDRHRRAEPMAKSAAVYR